MEAEDGGTGILNMFSRKGCTALPHIMHINNHSKGT